MARSTRYYQQLKTHDSTWFETALIGHLFRQTVIYEADLLDII